jgi:lipopolysaccharide transport protein LptA
MVTCLAVTLLAVGVASGEEGKSTDGVSIGVAPFERVAASGAAVPDIASSLAQRLSTKGVEHVVGPRDLGGKAAADPAAEEVVAWAKQAEVDLVVVGRTTRLGESLSVDTRLRSAVTGASLGTPIVVEASGPSDLGTAIDELATLVLEATHRNRGDLTTARARRSRASALEPDPSAAPEQGASASEKSPFRADAPISIKSDVLEAFDRGGRKKFIFTGHVRAVQEDLHLRSDRLEAFYPPGKSQPERLVATGNVVITQTGKRALCKKATYFRAEQKMVCVGDAQLDQECDRVRGTEIVFHLDTEILEVNGAADVRIHPDGVECEAVDPARRAGG